jgi:hypothetical protein
VNAKQVKATFAKLKADQPLAKALLGKEGSKKHDVQNFIKSQFKKDDPEHEPYEGGTFLNKDDLPNGGEGWAISTKQVAKDDVDWHRAGGDCDTILGLCLVLPWLGYACAEMSGVVMRLIPQIVARNMTAIALYRGATTACEVVIAVQVFLLWVTFCFKFGLKEHRHNVRKCMENLFTNKDGEDRIEKLWKMSLFGQTGLMIGGFAPRLAALSMGFLLFAGGTLVSPDNKSGGGGLAGMAGYDGCRANGAEYTKDVWLKRIWRHPADGCLGGSNVKWYAAYFKSGDTFVVDDLLDAGAKWNFTKDGHQFCRKDGTFDGSVTCWQYDGDRKAFHQYDIPSKTFTGDEEPPLTMKPTKGGFEPANLVNPWTQCSDGTDGCTNGFTNETVSDHVCGYQCVKWKQLSVSAVIKVSGAVFTGAFFLTKIIEGWTSTMGYELITKDTSVTKLVRLLGVVRQYRTQRTCFGKLSIFLRKRMRRTACALQLALFWLMSYFLAPTLNIDGFFTADYYTTLIFIFAGLVSVSQRYYNAYMCAPLLYTRDLWLKGEDEFVAPDEKGGQAKKKKVTLYDWIHLLPDERADYLFKYARAVSEAEVKDMKGGVDAPERGVISVSFCEDTQSITDYVLAKTVPRKLGMPSGAHGMVQKITNGKYEIQWKRVIGCGNKHDLTLAHITFLVDTTDLQPNREVENREDDKEVAEVEKWNTQNEEQNLKKMREKLCSGDVNALSEGGKAFVIGCALKWHVLEGEEGSKTTRTVHNMGASPDEMKNWPTVYMKHMKKWSFLRPGDEGFENRFKEMTDSQLEENDLHRFWGRTCAGQNNEHEDKHCTMQDCRWEGCVEPHMILESNAEWMAARQLLGIQALKR